MNDTATFPPATSGRTDENLALSVPQLAQIDSRNLLQGARAIGIAHAGQCYVLRVTRENKLILTK